MMARTQLKRSSTLIDPESLKQRPVSALVRADTTQSPGDNGLMRRNSANAKTLITFDEEIPGAPRGSAYLGVGNQPSGAGDTKSVFGVDTLWEKELEKLRKMEAEEAEEKKRAEERGEDARKKKGKGKRKGRGKEKEGKDATSPSELFLSPSTSQAQDMSTSSAGAPAMSSRRSRMLRAPPPPVDGGDSEEEDESDSSSVAGRPAEQARSAGWYSDEDEVGPRRTPGSGPRYPNLPPRLRALQDQEGYQGQPREEDEDSEEDLPLVATIGRAAQRVTRMGSNFGGASTRRTGGDSSDEDAPLSKLLDKTKTKLSVSSPPRGASMLSPSAKSEFQHDEDEDDAPLGLRVSRIIPSSYSQALSPGGGGMGEDEDDRPLALHPDQMRKSQYVMAAHQQQQQQQQQMMMQAAAAQMQMQHSMMFGAPSIMSAPFFGPPMGGPGMMIPPQLPGTPPPMQDAAKLTRVDKWRHDVAVEEDR
ncbi:hypothetical protein BC835DRAFT_178646 [Cytidiella melzeri]|nr:hypothetical protein BC835DRAFT_178646 [Cytidiella melzeri]